MIQTTHSGLPTGSPVFPRGFGLPNASHTTLPTGRGTGLHDSHAYSEWIKHEIDDIPDSETKSAVSGMDLGDGGEMKSSRMEQRRKDREEAHGIRNLGKDVHTSAKVHEQSVKEEREKRVAQKRQRNMHLFNSLPSAEPSNNVGSKRRTQRQKDRQEVHGVKNINKDSKATSKAHDAQARLPRSGPSPSSQRMKQRNKPTDQ